MELQKIAQYDDNKGLTMQEALEAVAKRKLRLPTNLEIDARLQGDEWKKEKQMYPCWTGTHIQYKAGAATALVWNEGEKKTKIKLPLQDGWYLPDKKYGIPNGEKSDSSNPAARYLWRYQDRDFNGLVARRYGGWFDWYRRYVYCYYVPNYRLGVFGTATGKVKSPPHKHEWICKTCGEERGGKSR